MAKQIGEHTITGSIDNLCFYKMEGQFYVRMKSSLTGKRVKKDPVFAKTMHYAQLLGNASKIASRVYKKLGKEQKVKGLFKQMTGQALLMLKADGNTGEAESKISAHYQPASRNTKTKKKKLQTCILNCCFADALLANIFSYEAIASTPMIETQFCERPG